jgi:hypothetical protein
MRESEGGGRYNGKEKNIREVSIGISDFELTFIF